LRVKKHNKAVNRRQQSWLGLLARAMGHRKVYPVDWNKMPPVDLVTIDYESFAEDNNQKALLEEAYCIVK